MTAAPSDALHVGDILHWCDIVLRITGIGRSRYLADDLDSLLVRLAMERCLQNIGEITYRLSPSFLDRNKDIPSAQIVGLRNVLAHKYGDIDHSILWYIAIEDVPELARALRAPK